MVKNIFRFPFCFLFFLERVNNTHLCLLYKTEWPFVWDKLMRSLSFSDVKFGDTWMYMPQGMCGGQRTTWGGGWMPIWGNCFSPFTMWIPRIELRQSVLAASSLPSEPSHGPLSVFFCSTFSFWLPAFQDRLVVARTTIMWYKGKTRAVLIYIFLTSLIWKSACFRFY